MAGQLRRLLRVLRTRGRVPERGPAERTEGVKTLDARAVEVQQRAHLQSLVASSVRVLVEGESRPSQTKEGKIPQRVMGRSERNEIVHIDVVDDRDPRALIGRFLDVSVARANAHSLVGELSEETVRGLPPKIAEAPKKRALNIVAGV